MPKELPPPNSGKLSKDHPAGKLSQKTVYFDWQEWTEYFEEDNYTEQELKEFIETYWQIVLAFVDLQFEVKFEPDRQETPETQFTANVDKSENSIDLTAALRAAVVQSKNSQTQIEHTNAEKEPMEESIK